MGDARDAAAMICRLRQGGETTQLGDGWVSSAGTTTRSTAGSSSSLFSSTSSSLTDDDDATSSSPPGRHSTVSSSSSSLTTSSDRIQTVDGAAAAGPLYELSTMLDHLPSLRTGLSKYYRGRSQSFITPLADVSCVEDLAKNTTPYSIRRTKASRGSAAVAQLGAKNQLSKKIAKKVPADSILSSKASRNASLLRSSSNRPPAAYRC